MGARLPRSPHTPDLTLLTAKNLVRIAPTPSRLLLSTMGRIPLFPSHPSHFLACALSGSQRSAAVSRQPFTRPSEKPLLPGGTLCYLTYSRHVSDKSVPPTCPPSERRGGGNPLGPPAFGKKPQMPGAGGRDIDFPATWRRCLPQWRIDDLQGAGAMPPEKKSRPHGLDVPE